VAKKYVLSWGVVKLRYASYTVEMISVTTKVRNPVENIGISSHGMCFGGAVSFPSDIMVGFAVGVDFGGEVSFTLDFIIVGSAVGVFVGDAVGSYVLPGLLVGLRVLFRVG